jgi:TatD DNase family protein
MARASRYTDTEETDRPPTPEPLAVPVLDSHCHLDLMGGDVATAYAESVAVGINRLVTVGIDVASSEWAADTAAAHEGIVSTAAIHPNEAPKSGEAEWNAIAELARRPEVRAIGETGLDHFRTDDSGWPAQEESFRRHIAIAKEVGKALVIHDREAHDDVLRVLDAEGAPDTVVFHCFSGDADVARRCADAGYVMSFAGNVTFKNADDLRAAAAVAPIDQLLVETDAPFLAPMPHRGKPNAPYLVPLTVRALAEIKQVDVDELCTAISATGDRVFDFTAAGG